jgi:hypothetical protein
MAIALDANLSSPPVYASPAASSVSLTTTATAAAGSKIIVFASCFDALGALADVGISASAGGLTWGLDLMSANGDDWIFVWSADAPSGLPSGTVITMDFFNGVSSPTNVNARVMAAVSFVGLASGLATLASSSAVGTTSWSGGSITTVVADSLLIGFGMVDGAQTAFTPAAGYTEIHDWIGATDNESWESIYRIASATGTYTAGGSGGSGLYEGGQLDYPASSVVSTFARPDADVTDGGWTNQAGTNVNLFQSIDESVADDTDYISSGLAPSSDMAEINLSNITP